MHISTTYSYVPHPYVPSHPIPMHSLCHPVSLSICILHFRARTLFESHNAMLITFMSNVQRFLSASSKCHPRVSSVSIPSEWDAHWAVRVYIWTFRPGCAGLALRPSMDAQPDPVRHAGTWTRLGRVQDPRPMLRGSSLPMS